MSERKPPEDNAQGPADADSRPDWISELYQDADSQMPPAEVDTHIMQLAAKKVETPRGARHRFHPQNKWLGALASAAVVVLSIGVFLRGGVTEQALQVSPDRTEEVAKTTAYRKSQLPAPAALAPAALEEVAVDEDSSARAATSERGVAMDAPVPALRSVVEAEPSTMILRQSKQLQQPAPGRLERESSLAEEQVSSASERRPRANKVPAEQKQERDEMLSDAVIRLVSASSNQAAQAPVASLVSPDCDDLTVGLCVTAAGQFMVHRDCEARFQIPVGAQDVTTVEGSVVLSLDSTVQHVQCLDGQWQVDEQKIE